MTARLALVGAPGSGTSAVARELAAMLGAPLRVTDEDYAAVHGQSVADAVITDEAAFRVAEEALVLRALAEPDAVVAVGSGATSPAVTAALATVPVVWLEVGLAQAARETGLSGMRPLQLGNVRGQLHQMLQDRARYYAAVADVTIAVDGRSVPQIAEEIRRWEATR